MIDFGREICGQLPCAERREWLVTNGIGGYAAGTIAGVPTRRYHGLLIAALDPPVGRALLLSKLAETVVYDQRSYLLHVNRGPDGIVEPQGYRYLERFHLEGTTPVWTYACADASLEKIVWMALGANTIYTRYRLMRATRPFQLMVKAIVNHRDHHSETHADGRQISVQEIDGGVRIRFQGREPFYLFCDRGVISPQGEWYGGTFLSVEDYRGLEPLDENYIAAEFEATLLQGESLTLVASTEEAPNLDADSAYQERRRYERGLIETSGLLGAPGWVRQLVLAADQFVVRRSLPGDPEGRTVIAGYPWFSDWGRDTMISLPGLALVTKRFEEASRVLRTFAHYVDQGMLPNRFPDKGDAPEYNTVDATLWYFEALRAYHAATGDDRLLAELYPVLKDIIAWHQKGTRYGIQMDPADGLLEAGVPGVQLTWMDAKVGDWVVTPREGKPVEINALWYNALRSMADFAERLGEEQGGYQILAQRAKTGFARFWNADLGYCFDVIDGPGGDDPALRPNQLFAVSLPHSPLTLEQGREVVDACARHLLTSHGLRSLAPGDPAYVGSYGGDIQTRDGAYHQGTVWSWLIGPFVSAHLRVYNDPEGVLVFLHPLARHLVDGGVGSISEIFDGDPPFTPRGCFAQAWGVAEVLRAWDEIQRRKNQI
jgi:predicted glycogen debranching enzyme